MTHLPTAEHFSFLFIGQILAFSLCFIVVERITRPVVIWLFSNLLTAIGYGMAPLQMLPNADEALVVGGFFTLFAGALKAFAFSDRKALRRSNFRAHILLAGALLTALMLIFAIDTPYRMLLVATSGLLASLSAILYLKGNRAWLGLRPAILTEAVLWLSIAAFASRIAIAYPFGDVTRFADTSSPLNQLLLAFFQFMLQISFLGLIVSRQLREQQFRARRAGRVSLQSIAMRQKQSETASIAEERFQLLKMLTHEVRQPLNTAQAALQSVIEEVGHGNTKPDQVRPVLDRALVTLNSIALSISNSILGATLITKGRTAQFQMIDLCSISQMALLDINPADRARIEHRFAQEVIFAEADPIVLRLAIRNLLENALKYSPAKSKVLFQLQVDEDEMGAIFTITNEVANLSTLDGDIFGLEKRGADSRYEGFGLGLYIVKEVAVMHRGHLDYTIADDKNVTFALHLPC